MGMKIGFGLTAVCEATLSPQAKSKLLNEFAAKGWSTHFIEVSSDYTVAPPFPQTVYSVSHNDSSTVVTDIAQPDSLMLEQWNANTWPMDPDDSEIVFEFDVFLPNSNLGDSYEYFTLPHGSERMVSSIDYAIRRIEAQLEEYIEDNSDGELEEDIERLNEYLDIFHSARKNNFIVSFSW